MEELERAERKMDFEFDGGYDRVCFEISESLYQRFRKAVRGEGQGVARLISQFLVGYILFLDLSFPKPEKKIHGPTRMLQIRVPEVVCARYRDKCTQDRIGLKGPIWQFMVNYLDLLENSRDENARGRAKADS